MIRKSEGIVLRTLRHQDSNLIAKVFTRDYGLITFILPGYYNARSRRRHSYFQPLSMIEVVYQERPNRDLQKPSETKLAVTLLDVQTDPVKLALGLAMLEVFADTVGEDENEAHYFFLKSSILQLERSSKRLIQIFLYFLIHHTRYLGFFPNDESGGQATLSFDPEEGTIRRAAEANAAVALMRQFMHSELSDLPDPASCQQIVFSTDHKRQLIQLLFDYYRRHVTGFRYPQTMKVFAEVFAE